ncbi:FAM172 family protein like [Pseudolycoriella hygida]|uniref:FAM172 family protein like n=1 Tax=Pseudolycoriella hygida TaxID=35572 RepID=A0A9Q0RWJ1_9DIPT|nr:FAM172 family protein like [Pseudolycoriella hygida]
MQLDICKNWVASSEPLNAPTQYQHKNDVQRVSAGHREHEWTSWSAMEVLFEYLEYKYKEFIENNSTSERTKDDL